MHPRFRRTVTVAMGGAFGLLGMLTGLRGQTPIPPEAGNLPNRAATLLGLRCLACHNATQKAGGLDLTTRAAALRGRGFVPLDAQTSRLVRQVEAGKMPPDGRLPQAEVTLLRQWVAAGAAYARPVLVPLKPSDVPLWSFQPIRRFAVPHSRFESLSANPVDRFIFAKLEAHGLQPSPPAERSTMLRRVTIDLTGLPPTPQEIQAFVQDRSPQAYAKVVDRLLASPAYGERWGRHWLDVVRYGESHGYEQNHLRPNAWPYRDYVIRAFNQDTPFPQFVREQLAGDIVGRGDPKVEVATGFLVAGIHDTVGNSTEEGTRQQRSNDLDDMVSTTGAAFLGLTVNCAKCHDHKFDPIPARDYYRLTAVFAGVQHGERPLSTHLPTAVEQAELNRIEADIQKREENLANLRADVLRRRHGANGAVRLPVEVRRNVDDFPPVAARFVRFTVLATNSGSEPCLDELQVFAPGSTLNLALSSRGAKATASSALPGYAIHQVAHLNDGLFGNAHSWISREPSAGWAQIELPETTNIGRVVWGRDAEGKLQDRLPTAYRIDISLDGQNWHEVANGNNRLPASENLSLEALTATMDAAERAQAETWQQERMGLERRRSALAPIATAYCGQFTAPDPTFLLKGGDVMQRGDPVAPGALSLLTTLPSELNVASKPAQERNSRATLLATLPGGEGTVEPRLALANWIADPRNPLPARVFVNRVWEHHFGRGIVDTPSDFGHIGSPPSHPELLDWLASDFMTHGWTLKRLHRLLVTSYTYRQANTNSNAGAAKDGDNRLLWRMPLRRMEAEAVRDSILQTSGKLDRSIGGAGYALFQYNVVNVALYDTLEEQGPETWRRGIYQIPARGIHDDLLGTFDCPDSSERTPQRTSTTTALQALSLLNSRFLSEQSDYFAARIQKSAPTTRAQIQSAFRQAFGRLPTSAEAGAALPLVQSYGLPTLCRALLNANEFLYY